MSQKVSRKTVTEDKDKRSPNSPVKEMKKKMAANAEKEKQAAAEKTDKVEKIPEKSADKNTEKTDKSEKLDNNADKKSEKKDNVEKKKDTAEKKKDTAEKKKDNTEKKNEPKQPEPQAEKNKEESSSKDDKSGKAEKEKSESKKSEPSKPKQNGRDRVHNGVSDVTLGNGTDDVLNGTVSADSEDEDVMLVIDDHDELFPELTYDDTSDVECFEPPTPENAPSRSFTRRSQVKAARTPETPRPAERAGETPAAEPKDSKMLKLKEDAPATDRKLRSADSPRPESKKQDSDKKQESDNKEKPEKETDKEASKDVVGDKTIEASKSQEEKLEIEVVVEVEANDGDEVPRKTDTNFSKSRVKVSPYRRSMRLADQTNTSLIANYTGNNTTMEMDITESSSILDESNLDDSSYLRGLRNIRGRKSYKLLKELNPKHIAHRTARANWEASRPTGTVVGRKRLPDHPGDLLEDKAAADAALPGAEALAPLGLAPEGEAAPLASQPKRPRVAEPPLAPLLTLHRRNAPIVGINTDLPLTAPVAADAPFDPESLKSGPPDAPVAVPLTLTPTLPQPQQPHQRDNKRCVVM